MKKSLIIRGNNPRKQHIIPRAHLEQFTDGRGRLFVYEKAKPIRTSAANREAVERDYFECKIPGKETNFRYEKKLAKIEDMALPAYRTLLKGKELEQEEAASWALYLASIFLRSRKVRVELSNGAFDKMAAAFRTEQRLRDDQCEWFKRTGQLVTMREIGNAAERALAELADPAHRQINTLEYSTPNLARALGLKRWQVIEPAQGFRFITSDAPVFTFSLVGSGSFIGGGWGLPHSHVAFPLDPFHMFIASPPELTWNPVLDEHNSNAFIETVAQFADKNVFASESLQSIQDMIDRRSGQLVFGRDAYREPAAVQ